MGINKVEYGNQVLVDLTDATATASQIIQGYTAYGKEGELITGIAKGESAIVQNLSEFQNSYSFEQGFLLSYTNAETGLMYVTNTVNTKGAYVEISDMNNAGVWYFEKISGGTARFNVYTYIDNTGTKYYMYNNTGAGANFMGLSDTSKAAFDISEVAGESSRFYWKISNKNAWLQHSKSGEGFRLWTAYDDPSNPKISFIYNEPGVVPYGTLTITENGTYDITRYKTVIVNIS